MKEIRVLIPNKEAFGFSLYAEGVLIGKENFDGFTEIILDANYPFSLYYTYLTEHKGNRRVYICHLPDKSNINLCTLPNLNKNIAILDQLQHRSFDNYKRSMDYLNKATAGEFYKLSPGFFWQLSNLAKHGLNSQDNLKKLVRKYNPAIKIEENIKWR